MGMVSELVDDGGDDVLLLSRHLRAEKGCPQDPRRILNNITFVVTLLFICILSVEVARISDRRLAGSRFASQPED